MDVDRGVIGARGSSSRTLALREAMFLRKSVISLEMASNRVVRILRCDFNSLPRTLLFSVNIP